VEGNDPYPIVGVCGIRRMRERRVEKKGDDQMARREQISIFVCKKEDLCVQIRFLCRLHRG
jgi:hypothetical protein